MNPIVSIEPNELNVNHRITSLTLEKVTIEPDTIRNLLAKGLPNLQKLRLSECDLSNTILQISVLQLERWMGVVLSGNFSSIDLSEEDYLPAPHIGVILENLRAHFEKSENTTPLLSLDLSKNNLNGQADKLAALLKVCPELSTLKLSRIIVNPDDLITLCDELVKFNIQKDKQWLGYLTVRKEPRCINVINQRQAYSTNF